MLKMKYKQSIKEKVIGLNCRNQRNFLIELNEFNDKLYSNSQELQES
jgi:hypothetical protein